MSVPKKLALAVFNRDSFRCAACPRQGHEFCTPQHRKNRQMGGSTDPIITGFQNLITLCAFCNGALESDPSFAETGRLYRWKLRTALDIVGKPVFFAWAREWRLLDAVGGFTVVDGRDSREEES